MTATVSSKNGVYEMELENGGRYWSMPGEKHKDFIARVKEAVWEDHKVRIKRMEDCTWFYGTRSEALHTIGFIDYELGRMGRDEGKKPVRRDALKKIIEIIDLYNAEEWEKIASIEL